MSLTSDELNTLIYRYLRESGFDHSAFTFGHESMIHKTNIDTSQLTSGALIHFVQKGLQYVEIETHLNEDGTTTICNAPFNIFNKHTCKVVNKKKILGFDELLENDYNQYEIDDTYIFIINKHNAMVTYASWSVNKPLLITVSADNTARIWNVDANNNANIDEIRKQNSQQYIYENVKTLQIEYNDNNTNGIANGINGISSSKDETMNDSNNSTTTDEPSNKRHKPDNNNTNNTDKINTNSTDNNNTSSYHHHMSTLSWCSYGSINRSLICSDWSIDSNCTAIGSYDGKVLLAELEYNINQDNETTITNTTQYIINYHTAPVSIVRWNKAVDNNATILATASLDGNIALWQTPASAKQHLQHQNNTKNQSDNNDNTQQPTTLYQHPVHHSTLHKAPIIDLQWRNDTQFASCAADGSVYYHTITNTSDKSTITAHKLGGHNSDVNQLAWDFSHSMLASCSDDTTVRIWNGDTGDIIHTLTGHTKEVTCLAWISSSSSNTDDNIDNSNNIPSPSLLASGSLDSTIRVWDITSGCCVGVLGRQQHPVTMLAYNAQAQLLAAAAYQRLFIFSIVDGSLIKTYAPSDAHNNTSINHITWDVPSDPTVAKYASDSVATAQRLLVSYSDNNTFIIDLRVQQ